jgi:hypothetical protein
MVREECIVLAREHQSRYCFPKHILGTLQLWQWFQLLIVEVKQILHLAHNKSNIEKRVRAVIDKFAERGLRALGVAYQVCDPWHASLLHSLTTRSFVLDWKFMYRKCQMVGKRVLEDHGNSLGSCHFSTPLAMIVQKLSEGHSILVSMSRWLQVCHIRPCPPWVDCSNLKFHLIPC